MNLQVRKRLLPTFPGSEVQLDAVLLRTCHPNHAHELHCCLPHQPEIDMPEAMR